MARLPHPTATRIPGLTRRASLEPSHCRRVSAATSATAGCGAVWRTSWTGGMSTEASSAVGSCGKLSRGADVWKPGFWLRSRASEPPAPARSPASALEAGLRGGSRLGEHAVVELLGDLDVGHLALDVRLAVALDGDLHRV